MIKNRIYIDNIEVMKKRYNRVVAFIENDSDYMGDSIDFDATIENGHNEPVLKISNNNTVLTLNSGAGDNDICDAWFNGLKDKWEFGTKIYMYGFGNGMYVKKFLKTASGDCSIIVHEPDARILKKALETFDLRQVFNDERFCLVFEPLLKDTGFFNYYSNNYMNYADVVNMRTTFCLNYPRIYPNSFRRYMQEINRTSMIVQTNRLVSDRFGHDYNRNIFNNFKYLLYSKSIEDLRDKTPEGLTAFVVAAGPSLDKNVDALKAAVNNSIIIAADTALRPLSMHGIIPDIAVAIDGKKDSRYLSREDTRNVPLVCAPSLGSDFMNTHTGIKFFIDSLCYHANSICKKVGEPLLEFDTGGSVANTAFSIAKYLKCKTIVFVGQDLAYTDDKTHSTVTVRGEKKTEVEDLENVVWDVDIYGNKIRSSGEFQLYRECFEEAIAKAKDIKVIDATEGGVRIKGTIIQPLKETIMSECSDREVGFSHILSEVRDKFDNEKKATLCNYIREIPAHIEDIKKLAVSVSSYYQKMIDIICRGENSKNEMSKLYIKCKECSDRIDSYDEIEYINNQLQEKVREFYNKVNRSFDNEEQELLESCKIGKKNADDIVDAIDDMGPILDPLSSLTLV